jgi:hypothetical protein
MLDILSKHLEGPVKLCTVALWIDELPKAEKEAFGLIMENNKNIKIALLFKDLDNNSQLHFKLTAFRSHLRGYCTCLKN